MYAFRDGSKRFRHPVVGEFRLDYEALYLPDDSGLQLPAYSAEPGSAAADALALLATWAASTAGASVSSSAGD